MGAKRCSRAYPGWPLARIIKSVSPALPKDHVGPTDPIAIGMIHEGTTARFRALVLLTGLLVPQLLLHGTSLVGTTVPYPCDLLALPGFYLPGDDDPEIEISDHVLTDLILEAPMHRDFMAREYRAGRIPLWNPDTYLGVPYANVPKFSPFELLHVLFPSPRTVAWMSVLQALLAGVGAYVFFRRILGSSFPAAAVCACSYPLTGYFVLWNGFSMTHAVAWLPWVLLATDAAVRRPCGWGGPALLLVTCLCVQSRIDAGGQVLIVAGLYALAVGIELFWSRGRLGGLWPHAIAPIAAWTLGLALCTPYILPAMEYARTGSRLLERAEGLEERPPGSLARLPQAVVPYFYGSTRRGSIPLADGNLLESAAGAHAGVVAMAFLAPLGFASRRHRSKVLFFSGIVVLGLAWKLGLPGFVQALRSPVLNMLSHNRFVFASAFGCLVLAAIGWDALAEADLRGRVWLWFPALFALFLGGWCLLRAILPPEPLAGRLFAPDFAGLPTNLSPDERTSIFDGYVRTMLWGSARLALAGGALVCVWAGRQRASGLKAIAASMLIAELFAFALHDWRHADAKLFYPRIPALEDLRQLPPGRILGLRCLPPNLGMTHGLRDIRGYDAVDPRLAMELLGMALDPRFESPRYARTQWMVPLMTTDGSGFRLSPVLDMLNVRYLINRSPPPGNLPAVAQSSGYWVVENSHALPRAWIPRTVETLPDLPALRKRIAAPDFAPREVAFVEVPIPVSASATGSARIAAETTQTVQLETVTDRTALVVLSEMWYPGWTATVDGQPAEIHRTNIGLRGVVVPPGTHKVAFSFWPESLTRGLWIAGAAASLAIAWTVWVGMRDVRVRLRKNTRPV